MDYSLKIIHWFICIGIILFHEIVATGVRVTIDQGTLEGKLLTTDTGFVYRAFYAIPYAKPPIGNLRFKDPVAATKWNGVLNATVASNVCAQNETLFIGSYIGEEDCLYLNVYAPNTTNTCNKLPVMFWIHGGGFVFGDGNDKHLYKPDYLVEKNVIVVSVNYRLGVLGFLSLDNEHAPGNMGIKDQALALKWVNKNIHKFGGDSNSITLFGESAGAASVNYLALSPLAKGKFSKIILQSGTSQNEWALQYDDNIKHGFNLGKALGIQTSDKKSLIKSLLNIPVKDLVIASYSSTVQTDPIYPVFGPIVEKIIPGLSTLLSEDPHLAMQSINMCGKPVLIGVTAVEALLFILTLNAEQIGAVLSGNATVNQLVPDFKICVPKHLQKQFDNQTMEIAAEMIKEFYFPTSENVVNNFINLLSDFSMVKDIHEAVQTFSRKTKTFYYNFAYNGSLNLLKLFYPIPYDKASHLDDLGYLFKVQFDKLTSNPPVVTDMDRLTIRRMTEMWTNFAKYGNPTPKLSEAINTIWEPVSRDNLTCLLIDKDLKMVDDPYKDRMKIWQELENLHTSKSKY